MPLQVPVDGRHLVDPSKYGAIGNSQVTTSPSPRVAADDLHRAIFDRSADALIVIDERMEVVEANLAAGELLGISADELVGRRLDGFTETSRLSELLTGDRENHLRAEPVSVRRPDGHVRHVEAVDVVEVSAGLTMLTLRSIIEQRNGAGSRNDARLRLVQTAGRLGTWDWDLRSNAVNWSPELEELHGLEPGTFDGTFDFVLSKIHPDDRQAFIAATEDLKRDGQHYIEYRIVLPDGTVRWVAGRGQLFRNDAREGIWALGVCIDITERHDEQERLAFMIEAGRALGSSLEYGETLRRVATLAVPRIADWCVVHVLSETGVPEVVALSHVKPEKVAWARALQERYPRDPDAMTGVPAVLRSGKPELVSDVPLDLLASLDLKQNARGDIIKAPAGTSAFLDIFGRTFLISGVVTLLTLILGFPLAYWITTLPRHKANLIFICILIPFWTSVLVRIAAWIVLLQRQGLINNALMSMGVTDAPLALLFNRAGVYIAMTHILLPFMILPIYSVMQSVPNTYQRAAISLGSHPFAAFWRVYVPQTYAGIGAGTLLVFIIAIGYYITPALLGGADDQMISYYVAYFTNQTINWGMASALGFILLIGTLLLYSLYRKLSGRELGLG